METALASEHEGGCIVSSRPGVFSVDQIDVKIVFTTGFVPIAVTHRADGYDPVKYIWRLPFDRYWPEK